MEDYNYKVMNWQKERNAEKKAKMRKEKKNNRKELPK